MNLKIFLSFLLMIILNNFIYSNDNLELIKWEPETNTERVYRHEFGWAVGTTTGSGISYRYWFNEWGIQFTFLPNYIIYTKDINYNNYKFSFFSIGFSILYQNKIGDWSRFFLYLSLCNYVIQNYNINNEGYQTTISGAFNIGFGPGIEFFINKNIGLNIMGGFANYNLYIYSYNQTERIPVSQSFLITIEFAIYYRL